ncbi:hypothetical protein T11_7774 [Trichinella zimbabwensis]|uniref:Uncharacterized protein n=1 Tax=Trichinella zimbabwensis TaxID=268475 RepID=A0A0V1H1C0_9BILA|nr:hypothetical protein T11_7774 [Trichinella zimbabwensis]
MTVSRCVKKLLLTNRRVCVWVLARVQVVAKTLCVWAIEILQFPCGFDWGRYHLQIIVVWIRVIPFGFTSENNEDKLVLVKITIANYLFRHLCALTSPYPSFNEAGGGRKSCSVYSPHQRDCHSLQLRFPDSDHIRPAHSFSSFAYALASSSRTLRVSTTPPDILSQMKVLFEGWRVRPVGIQLLHFFGRSYHFPSSLFSNSSFLSNPDSKIPF